MKRRGGKRVGKIIDYHRYHMGALSKLSQWTTLAREVTERTAIVVNFLCLLHVTNTYICSPTLVYGPSMLPTLNLTGDVLLVEKLTVRMGKVGPGDIVLVRSPENPRKTVSKRILGMEGDRVTFMIDPKNSTIYHSVVVPKGHVWIQGDNIYASHDSRNFGPVPYGLIQGKVFFRVWPLNGFGSLRH